MPTLDSIQPYVDQVFDDPDVQRRLSRAASNLRGAKARASKRSLRDERFRRRVAAAARETAYAVQAIQRGPQKQQRRRRGRRLLGFVVIAAAGAWAYTQLNGEEA